MEDKKLSDATHILQKFASLIKEKSTKHLVKSFLELGPGMWFSRPFSGLPH